MDSVTRSQPPAAVLDGPLLPRARMREALGVGEWRSESTGRGALITMIGCAVAIVVFAAGAPSAYVPPSKAAFPSWMVGPLKGLGAGLPDDSLFQAIAFTGLIALMFAAYAVALACAKHVTLRWAAAALVALHAVFLLGPPLPLTDIFNYLNYARLGAVHAVNPYDGLPAAVPVDPSYGYATWHHLLDPYGPLFTLLTYPMVKLGLIGSYWTLKLATVAASGGCLALVWKLAERLGRPPLAAVMFVGLNPLVLVYGLGGVHNDFFMVGLILAGLLAATSSRPASSGAALTAAAGVKLSGGLVLPFALAGSGSRRRMALGAIAGGAAVAALSLAAFGVHGPGLATQSVLVTPLSPPNLLGLLLGQGGATGIVRGLVQAALIGTLAWLFVRTWHGSMDWLTAAGWASFALVVSLSWEMPWYVLWVLPFAVLAGNSRLRRATLVLTAFLALTLTPLTGYLISDVCHCSPSKTDTGKRNDREIRHYLR